MRLAEALEAGDNWPRQPPSPQKPLPEMADPGRRARKGVVKTAITTAIA
jgi:hypothetical protein